MFRYAGWAGTVAARHRPVGPDLPATPAAALGKEPFLPLGSPVDGAEPDGRPPIERSPLSAVAASGGSAALIGKAKGQSSKLAHEITPDQDESQEETKKTTTDVDVVAPPEHKEAVPAPEVGQSRHRLAAVAGTSTCYVVNTPEGQFVPGVWGPYRDPVFPGWWMNEGGQSATGQLIEFVITEHHAYAELQEKCKEKGAEMYDVLHDLLIGLQEARGVSSFTELTKDLHFYPDLHGGCFRTLHFDLEDPSILTILTGNRSPIADPKMRGSIVGLNLDMSLSDLACKFNVTLEAIALQTRHIVDEMNAHGHEITALYLSGSQAKNMALMALLANCCGIEVVIPENPGGAVVLGAAMLGRMAAEVAESGLHVHGKMDEKAQAERLWNIMVGSHLVALMFASC